MSERIEMYVNVCHCGHSKSAHYEEQHTCLGMLCECEKYTDRDDPLPKKMKASPPIPLFDEEAIDTPRYPIAPTTHPLGCTCSVCAFNFGVP